jgi:hypothetical protein
MTKVLMRVTVFFFVASAGRSGGMSGIPDAWGAAFPARFFLSDGCGGSVIEEFIQQTLDQM